MQRDGEIPFYEFIYMQGPHHAPQFRYSETLEGHTLGEGTGTSKQNAQQNAARDALKKLGNRHN